MTAAYDRTTRPVNLVHLRAVRKDGYVSARCVKHRKSSPMVSSVRDYVVSSDVRRVTCDACRMQVVR